jgi:hypothetical protein
VAKKKVIVVDAANVAFEERSKDGKPKLANILAVRRELEKRGYEPIFIADASLWHDIDDRDQFDALVEQQKIRQAPAQTEADYFILEVASDHKALVVSNDQFKPYHESHPWIADRRLPFMIVDGSVELYEPESEESR